MTVGRRIMRWLRPRSNGVSVGRGTWRHIRRGDRARRRADWGEAANAYRAALAAEPTLAHIWIQLGHAEKERGACSSAAAAYSQAAQYAPHDAEPHLRLGQLAKGTGEGDPGAHFLAALQRAPDDLAAAHEVTQHLLGRRYHDARAVDEALTLLHIDRAAVAAVQSTAFSVGTVFCDVTDLLGFFGFSRVPSGVQRVQIEIVLALLEHATATPIALCQYSSARQGWTVVATASFTALCTISLREEGDPKAWAAQLRLAYVAGALADDLVFPREAVLISFGASAPDANYLLNLRTKCVRQDLTYVPIVYDLIPILSPHWFMPALARGFLAYARSLVHSAQGYVAISAATKRDLVSYAATERADLAGDRVRVVALDGDAMKPNLQPTHSERLREAALVPGSFTLLVSTIEPRKNHVGAFRAWRRLAREIGEERMPRLVCVGGKGWLNDDVHAELAGDAALRRMVLILSNTSDGELDWLYRHCAFTLYPSFYEGWGLPVTESLCYGKLPVISYTSSLPEAGGPFAIYFDPQDPDSMLAVLREVIVTPGARARAEARIGAGYRPRPWRVIGSELVSHARSIAAATGRTCRVPPLLRIGEVMNLAAADGQGSRSSGEIYRLGNGWGLPGTDGCRAVDADAVLRMPPLLHEAVLRIDLSARDKPVGYATCTGVARESGDLAAYEKRSVRLAVARSNEPQDVVVAPRGEGELWVVGFVVEPAISD